MPSKEKTFKQLQDELDDVLARLQSADLDVDEAVKLYEAGQKLANQLETHLKSAQNKISKLKSAGNR